MKSGQDIGETDAHNFSASIRFAWFLYTVSPVIHGNQQITFWQLYHGSRIILKKSTKKMLLVAFKHVPVAVTFNKLRRRCERLETVPSCVKAPKHLPTEILFIILK